MEDMPTANLDARLLVLPIDDERLLVIFNVRLLPVNQRVGADRTQSVHLPMWQSVLLVLDSDGALLSGQLKWLCFIEWNDLHSLPFEGQIPEPLLSLIGVLVLRVHECALRRICFNHSSSYAKFCFVAFFVNTINLKGLGLTLLRRKNHRV